MLPDTERFDAPAGRIDAQLAQAEAQQDEDD